AHVLRGGRFLSRIGAILARVGVVRACLALLTGGAPAAPRYFVKLFGPMTARTLERLVGEGRKLPPRIHPVVQAHWCEPKCFVAMAEYLRVLDQAAAAAAQVGTASAGGQVGALDLPLVVISSGDQTPDVLEAHHALARLSSRGRHVSAEHSTHWIP